MKSDHTDYPDDKSTHPQSVLATSGPIGGTSEEPAQDSELERRYGYTKAAAALSLPAALSKSPDPISLLKALRRRWQLALVLGLFGAGLTAMLTANLSPTRYEAFALIRIATDAPYRVFAAKSDNFETYKQSQIKMITSTLLLEKAVHEHQEIEFLKKNSDALSWLKDNLEIHSEQNPEMVRLSLTSDFGSPAEPSSKEELAALVNAVADAFYDHSVTLGRVAKQSQLEEFERLHEQWNQKAWDQRELIDELARKLGLGNAEEAVAKRQIAWVNFHATQRDLQKLQFEMDRVEARLDFTKRAQDHQEDWGIPQSLIEASVLADPKIGEFKSQIDRLSLSIEKYTGVVRDTKRIDKMRLEKENRARELQAKIKEKRELVRSELMENKRRQLEEEANRQKGEIEQLEMQKKFLDVQMKDYAIETERIARGFNKLEFERGKLEELQGAEKNIGRAKVSLEVELKAPPRVELMDLADIARPQNATISGFGSHSVLFTCLVLGVVFLGVAFFEFHLRRVDSTQDVVQLGISVVGGLPTVPDALREDKIPSANVIRKSNASVRFMESLDEVRTLLIRDALLRDTRVVMITSPDAMEGKTTLSLYLSISLAYAGKKVLLIDGDLRRPSIHKRFGMSRIPGLGDALQECESIDQTVRPSSVEGLWVMTAGRVDHKVFRALAQERFGNILDILGQEYDFILIDTSPTLPVADTLQIGQHVDTTLLSVLRNITQLPKLYSGLEKLGAVDIQVLGAVVQGISRLEYYRYERQYRLPPSSHAAEDQSLASEAVGANSA